MLYSFIANSTDVSLLLCNSNWLACIPQTPCGLYCVTHVRESVQAVETVTVMELHCRLGHIAPASACTLVEKGLVSGIKLDPDSREAPLSLLRYHLAFA